MGACRRALVVVALALFAALPAQAAIMQAVYSGTIADGFDEGGYFFDVYTDLAGQAFAATFVYDTSRGTRSTFPLSDSVTGGSLLGGAAMPMLSALLTINGRSYGFGPVTIGAATIATDGTSLTRTEHRGEADSSDGTTRVEDVLLVGLRAPGVVVPNLDLPLALTDDDDFFQGSFVFARTDVVGATRTAYAGGRFLTDSVAITPVPLPAAAWLMLSGLGALGWFGRRHRAS